MKTPQFMVLMANNTLSDSKGEQCDCACAGNIDKSDILSSLRTYSLNNENDCACSSSSEVFKSKKYETNTFAAAPDLQYKEMVHGEFLVFKPSGNGVAVINPLGRKFLDSFNTPRKLLFSDKMDLVAGMIDLGLLEVGEEELKIPPPVSSQLLSAWLHLTDRCNLRCSYCYLPHVREDMSVETGHAAIDAIFRSAMANGFKQIKLKYAGGEPLLQFPLIEELQVYAQQLTKANGIVLEGVVLSNGTLLTVEMVEKLKSLNLRLMISLDGIGQYHDRHRPYAGGRSTFSDVSEAVDLALTSGLVPNISVTVSSRTTEGLSEVMSWILDRELPFSLNFYRENELSASYEDMQLDEGKIINGMLAAFKVIENNLPRQSFLGGIIDRANLSASHTHTCGVGQNYLVFDQNGQVAKCQMHIRKPVTSVHAADPLALIRADQIGIQNLPVMEKMGCKTCEWKHWCTGGCPLATHRATGRYDVKSPNCNIYKTLFPEALRLEGLRLLKYQGDPNVVVKI